MNFAFITRHAPTPEQVALATAQDITLHSVGDADAFTVDAEFVHEAGNRLNVIFEGVVVVHPAAALQLCSKFLVGVFKNANRAEPDQPPQFAAKSLHVYDLRN